MSTAERRKYGLSTLFYSFSIGSFACCRDFCVIGTQEAADSLKLRRANKIKPIQSTLAIEGNTLSLKQVTDIIDGKCVIAPLREIQEVKNAIDAYDFFQNLIRIRPKICSKLITL